MREIEKNTQLFIETMNKELEGTILPDESGRLCIFRNGRWHGLCCVIDKERETTSNGDNE